MRRRPGAPLVSPRLPPAPRPDGLEGVSGRRANSFAARSSFAGAFLARSRRSNGLELWPNQSVLFRHPTNANNIAWQHLPKVLINCRYQIGRAVALRLRTQAGNMIGGDEHGSFRITTVASNEVVGTTGSRRAMKLGADAGPRTYARRHASPGSKARALAPSGRRCARPVRKTQQI